MLTGSTFNVYKGLQKPLVFKGFKGKFIYYGALSVILALILCAIVATVVSFMWGGMVLIFIMFGGLLLSAQLQKKGLHKKSRKKGIFIVSKIFSK